MSDYESSWDEQGAEAVPAPRMNIVNLAGAAVSLALVVGIGIWGYGIVVRDVSGVPVVRALEGPTRVQPEDPGGIAAAHQGLAVNAVAARGTAEPAPEKVVLAPRPVPIDQSDLITAALREAQAESARIVDTDPDLAQVAATADDASDAATDAILALADSLAAEAAPLEEITPKIAVAPSVEDMAAADGIARSLRPQVRPATLTRVAYTAASDTPGGARDLDPEAIVAGTSLVQLGAFASTEIAKEEWTKLLGRFEAVMSDKDRVIQKASSGGRNFYRLRAAGFVDISDARRFCSALVSEGADCIPVTVR